MEILEVDQMVFLKLVILEVYQMGILEVD